MVLPLTDGTHRHAAYPYDRGVANAQILGTLWDTSGKVIGAADVPLATRAAGQLPAGSAASDTQYLVSWFEQTSRTSYDLRVSRASAQGQMLTSNGIEVAANVATRPTGVTESPDPHVVAWPPATGWAGGYFVLAWQQASVATAGAVDLNAVRIAADGTLLDMTPTQIAVGISSNENVGSDSTDCVSPTMACASDRCLLAWHEVRDTAYRSDVRGALITPSAAGLTVGDAFDVIAAGGQQQFPAVVSDGNDFLVGWQDSKSGNYDINTTRVTHDGAVVGNSPVTLYKNPGTLIVHGPRFVFDGTHYIGVWDDNFGVQWGRVDPSNGACLDGNGIQLPGLGYVGDVMISQAGSYTVIISDNLAYRVDTIGNVVAEPAAVLPPGVITAPQRSIDGALFFTQLMHLERPYENIRVMINHLAY